MTATLTARRVAKVTVARPTAAAEQLLRDAAVVLRLTQKVKADLARPVCR